VNEQGDCTNRLSSPPSLHRCSTGGLSHNKVPLQECGGPPVMLLCVYVLLIGQAPFSDVAYRIPFYEQFSLSDIVLTLLNDEVTLP
jgi:hypothetical protein